ncbi:hypothetical protein L208DRAFT_1032835, partial [Tricholoma matsutake]
ITKIVNSLSAKIEMGAPMICIYLLGLPDHYTSHIFAPFYWQAFHVTLLKQGNQVIGVSPVSDYIFYPAELDSICLYDWVAHNKRVKKTKSKKLAAVKDDELQSHTDSGSDDDKLLQADVKDASKQMLFDFVSEHLLANSHCTHWLPKHAALIPNFIGSTLPRSDQGNHEYYCSAMLALFKPWCMGCDLKQEDELWNDAFTKYSFGTRSTQLMHNMNICYECLDTQDDFHAQMKKNV